MKMSWASIFNQYLESVYLFEVSEVENINGNGIKHREYWLRLIFA